MPPSPPTILATRYRQMFPHLEPEDIRRIGKYGDILRFRDGEGLFTAGQTGPALYVLLSGQAVTSRRDGPGHVTPLVEASEGQFVAELGQLSGGPALADGHALGETLALVVSTENLRRLLAAETALAERILRALALRRADLVEGAAGGVVLIGSPRASAVVRLGVFLDHNNQPFHVIDATGDAEAAALAAGLASGPGDLPVVVAPDGAVLFNPAEADLAEAIGLLDLPDPERLFDVAVVGAGPAGLAAAVHAAANGLDVAVLDARAFGGQADAGARIEDHLGFPCGIDGGALAARAALQAQKLGVRMIIPAAVQGLAPAALEGFSLALGGAFVRARTVVVASGARYRRPAIARLDAFEGRGVWRWASAVEARACAGQPVVLVGGGETAGRAAIFLSAHARKVTMMLRGAGPAASLSPDLRDQIERLANIEIVTGALVTGLEGPVQGDLQAVRWRTGKGGDRIDAVRHLFLFTGAEPATGWLAGCGVELDPGGYVRTGAWTAHGHDGLETNLAGVFAIGDVRAGSPKRVGAAMAEGAQVAQALGHRFRRFA